MIKKIRSVIEKTEYNLKIDNKQKKKSTEIYYMLKLY